MRASRVLQKCLGRSLESMHEARSGVLLRSVEALLAGRRLSNRHLHRECEQIYADMARWLLRSERPVIVIDWSDL